MVSFSVGAMLLAGTVSTGSLPLDFVPEAHVRGVWLTAADVLRPDARRPGSLNARLAQLRLQAVTTCMPTSLSAKALAERINREVPGVFALDSKNMSSQSVAVSVDQWQISSEQVTALLEDAPAQQCVKSIAPGCQVRLTEPAPALCLPRGVMELRTRVVPSEAGSAPLQLWAEVLIDGVLATHLRLSARPLSGFTAWQITQPVLEGQSLRRQDVVPVQVVGMAESRTRFDPSTGTLRATGNLEAGDVLEAAALGSLANGRAHETTRVNAQVGSVQVSRPAVLARDTRPGDGAWAYLDDGELVSLKLVGSNSWEMNR